MEEIQEDCQSPSDWGFMQDLASWSINDPEKVEGSAYNYTGGPGQWPEESWDHSLNGYH